MITVQEQEILLDKIKGLSEMEFGDVLREMAQHIYRNNWESMIDDCFDIETFEDELDSAKEEILDWRQKYRDADDKLQRIRDIV